MEIYMITANGVLTYDGTLRVGASNLRPDEYVDAEGVTRQGQTALLSLWRLDSPQPPERFRVHPGQTVQFDGYRLEVVGIGPVGRAPVVQVAICASVPVP